MWGYIVLFVGIIIFLFDLYFAFISFGFFKKGCKKCKGYLVHTVRRKNIYKRRFFYKNYLNFVYVYCVNGKEYHISEGVPGKKVILVQLLMLSIKKRIQSLRIFGILLFRINRS